MRISCRVILVALLAVTAAAQDAARRLPRGSEVLVRVADSARLAAVLAEDGPYRELIALLAPEQAEGLVRPRAIAAEVADLLAGPVVIGLRRGLLGRLVVQVAGRTSLDQAEVHRRLETSSVLPRPETRRWRGRLVHSFADRAVVLVLGDEILVAGRLDDLGEMLDLEETESALHDPALARLTADEPDADLVGALRLADLLRDNEALDRKPDDFLGSLVFDGPRRELAAAERLYFHATLMPDLVVRLRTVGDERPADWASANRPADLMPPLPDELGRLHLDRDIAAFWADRESIVSATALPGLAEFSQNLDTLMAGFSAGEFAAALDPGLDLLALARMKAEDAPEPLLPRLVLGLRLRQDRDPEVDDRIRVAFQTAIGAVNLSAGREHRRPFLQHSRLVAGVEILAARFVGPRPTQGPTLADNFEPALAIAGDRLFIASDPVGAAAAVAAAAGEAQTTIPGDRLDLSGEKIAALLLANRRPIEDSRMLKEGETLEEASHFVDRLAALAHAVERLVFRRRSTARGAVYDLVIRRQEQPR